MEKVPKMPDTELQCGVSVSMQRLRGRPPGLTRSRTEHLRMAAQDPDQWLNCCRPVESEKDESDQKIAKGRMQHEGGKNWCQASEKHNGQGFVGVGAQPSSRTHPKYCGKQLSCSSQTMAKTAKTKRKKSAAESGAKGGKSRASPGPGEVRAGKEN